MNFENFDIDVISNSEEINNPAKRNELKKLLKSLIREGEQIVKQTEIEARSPKVKPSNKLICPDCDKYFFSYENLTKHMVKEHEVDFKEEPTPSTSSEFVEDIEPEEDYMKNLPEIRIKKVKSKIEKLKFETVDENTCEICYKQLTSQRSLALHKTLIHSKPNTVFKHHCTKCLKGFRNKEILLQHDYKEHGGEKVKNLCNICGKDFSNKYRMINHIKTKHEKSISQVCPICGKRLYMSGSIQKHIDLHSDVRPFKCNQCDSAFKQKHDFTVHMRLHTGERPFQCRLCDLRFIANTNLHKHMKSAHKNLL